MNKVKRYWLDRTKLSLSGVALLAVVVGCNPAGPPGDATDHEPDLPTPDQGMAAGQGPLQQIADFDRFTLQASVGRASMLSDDMAQRYDLEKQDGMIMINLVILEDQQGRQPVPVAAEVRVQRESLSGHVETVDMRAAEANGFVSYIGTLDPGSQRLLTLIVEVMPEGTDEWLAMRFESELSESHSR